MSKGLVLGKFMPLHQGHLSLIDFAAANCNELFVLLCYTTNEPLSGALREQWLQASLNHLPHVKIISFEYDENVLPNTSVSDEQVSLLWSKTIQQLIPHIDVIFSSEPYGDYLARFLHCRHVMFDSSRTQIPVAASQIRQNPVQYWQYIAAAAKPHFVQKIFLLGTESTGKSTLTEKLAQHYQTNFVPEMARQILETTLECTPVHLQQIAALHAATIKEKTTGEFPLLFIDTDINITQSYSRFLFNEPLEVSASIQDANKGHLYLYLEADCPFVQDGTRLPAEERNKLDLFHKEQLKQNGISYFSISGNWQQRLDSAIDVINRYYQI